MSSWVGGNFYLTDWSDAQKQNAEIIYRYFLGEGWTLQAIAALLSNMMTESTINPGIWEGLNYGNLSGGYGLVQWTPATKLRDFAPSDWLSNYNQQLHMLDAELEQDMYIPNSGQWIQSSTYQMTFYQFTRSTQDPGTLAYVFMYNYERPGSLNQPWRQTNARLWYQWLLDNPLTPPPPIWMLFKIRWNNFLKGR